MKLCSSSREGAGALTILFLALLVQSLASLSSRTPPPPALVGQGLWCQFYRVLWFFSPTSFAGRIISIILVWGYGRITF